MATGTSQEALAAKMGVDRAHISSMEPSVEGKGIDVEQQWLSSRRQLAAGQNGRANNYF
jgi:hypothetical protein